MVKLISYEKEDHQLKNKIINYCRCHHVKKASALIRGSLTISALINLIPSNVSQRAMSGAYRCANIKKGLNNNNSNPAMGTSLRSVKAMSKRRFSERKAIKILHSFLDNVNKRSKDFQYLWVAEKQQDNKVFKDNIHFHVITNKHWEIKKWWGYWLALQKNNGIIPRDENYKPSSAFDVKTITKNNVKGIGNYLTHYVTKNKGEFLCQIWNCSKKVSWLYTNFIDNMSFIKRIEALEKQNLLGGERKIYPPKDYSVTHAIPVNRVTVNLYRRIDEKNKEVWNREKGKEVKNEL